MSVCEQCYRLYNNSTPFQVDDEVQRCHCFWWCLSISNNFGRQYLLTSSWSVTIQKLPVLWLVTLLENTEQYGRPHPYHNYIHRTQGHNPSCSSKYSAYWSDPLLLDIKGDSPPFTLIQVNISFPSNSILSVVPCRVNYKSSNWGSFFM